ncbi:hypothetical protein AAEP93_010940 [Penicillium crustosum]
MSLQIVAVEGGHGFQQALKEVPLNAFYQAEHLRNRMSREVYKYVLYPRQFALRFIHLTAKSSRLVSEPLDKIHHGPASQTVPVRDNALSRLTVPTSQPIKETRLRLTGQSVYATRSPPQQPTELIYYTAPVCIPKVKAQISTSQNRGHSTTMHERKDHNSLPSLVPSLGHQNI